jgi:hypothetical protein
VDSAGPASGRTQSFSDGASGAGPTASSLETDSAHQNDLVPHQFQAHSVLQQYIQSGNGMSAQDASRRLVGGGTLPSPNGIAMDTYEASRPLQTNRLNI